MKNSLKKTSPEYPKDQRKNKIYRGEVLLRTSSGPAEVLEKTCSYYWKACEEDILYWFNVFAWTYDPRKDGAACHIPFITYDFQDDYILDVLRRIRSGEDLIVEKSRDMGATWCIIGVFVWLWLFDPSFQGLMGSRKEQDVDNYNWSSLFGKVDYILDRLPEWMLGGFNKKKHRSHLKVKNPRNGNLIAGETANRDFSRSGRWTAILLDEFAFWDWGHTVWKATADSTRSRITISTSNGMGNKYYEIVRGIDSGKLNIAKYRLHWKLHPEKTEEWYRKECERRSPIEIAQELDISYENSVRGKMYDHFSYENNVFSGIDYNPSLPLYCAWDFGFRDPTAIIWLQKDPETNRVYIIDYYEKANKDIEFFVPFITGEIPIGSHHKYDEREMGKIRLHEKWDRPRKHMGDPTGGNTEQTSGKSVKKILAEHGIYVTTNYKKFKIVARYDDTYKLIRRLAVSDECTEFNDAITNARWNLPEDEMGALPKAQEPIHDWTSHARTALEYFAVNEPFAKKEKEEEKEDEDAKPTFRKGKMWHRTGRMNSRSRRNPYN